MQIHQVEHFVAAADHGSVRNGAAALGLTQQALSRSIAALERELGLKLFDRLGHGVALSSAGRAFLGSARRIVRDARIETSPDSGLLDIATWSTLAIHPTATLVGLLHRENPTMRSRIEQAPDEESVCRLVREGHCDVGTVLLPSLWLHDLTATALGHLREWLILPPGTRIDPGPVAWSTVAEHHLVVPAGGTPISFVGQELAGAGAELKLGVRSAHREAQVSLVLAGAGAALVTERYAEMARARGAVIRELDLRLARQIGIVHRRDRRSPLVDRFTELAVAHLPPR
ncbi:LysR family transcriptional regulator [Streptomyces sp. NPDC090052]|uniref:LysR family transcriptional regulator n=1 Tax=unclassified Streptomyces TaxID=2593676 RepID=UPI002252A1DB|nr:LysR family transcriptional regulator [Streptomyces sp. NBC_01306]MCX4724189.1 LysR family transcriptional regulator [Streptomyces sp. NBC_01306]